MIARITRGERQVIVDAIGEEAEARDLVLALMAAMTNATQRVSFPARLQARPAGGNAAALAERTRAWLARRGHVVEVVDS